MKRKNRVLKMMYCGNCAQTAYESKSKSRQIACKRVDTVKNVLKAVKGLGPRNTTVTRAERK